MGNINSRKPIVIGKKKKKNRPTVPDSIESNVNVPDFIKSNAKFAWNKGRVGVIGRSGAGKTCFVTKYQGEDYKDTISTNAAETFECNKNLVGGDRISEFNWRVADHLKYRVNTTVQEDNSDDITNINRTNNININNINNINNIDNINCIISINSIICFDYYHFC